MTATRLLVQRKEGSAPRLLWDASAAVARQHLQFVHIYTSICMHAYIHISIDLCMYSIFMEPPKRAKLHAGRSGQSDGEFISLGRQGCQFRVKGLS